MQSSPSRIFVAARAAICFGTAIEVGVLLGYTGLGLVAALGTFTAQYAPRRSFDQPAYVLPLVAALLAANLAVGASMSTYRWAIPAVVAASTLVMTCLCDLAKLPPPGMPIFILVCTIATQLPSGHVVEYVSLVLMAGIATSIVALSGRLLMVLPSRRHLACSHGDDKVANHRPVERSDPSSIPSRRSFKERSRQRLAELPGFARSPTIRTARRAAGAVLAAGLIADAAGLSRPYWAMFAAASLMGQGSYPSTVSGRALQRFVGTTVGVVVAGIAVYADPTATVLVVVLVALMFLAVLTITRNYALGLLFITPLALILTNAVGEPQPFTALAEQRLLETALGCGTGFLAAYAVSGRWLERELRLCLAGTTQAMTTQLTQHGDDVRSVQRWAERLDVVGQRGTHERRAVQILLEPYATSVEVTRQLALRTVESAKSPGRAGDAGRRSASGGHDAVLSESVRTLTDALKREFQIVPPSN